MRISLFRFLPFAVSMLAALPAAAEWVWERLDKPSPPSMYGHSMVYDSGRDRLVVYGGARWDTETYGNHHHPYVWEWDGETWLQASDSTLPANLSLTAMAYDAKRGVTVLFGGKAQGAGEENRTFEWNGSRWSEVFTLARPSARAGHAMVYDSQRGVIVMFGGFAADTWEFDGSSWRRVASTGPSARYFAPMAYDQARGKTVLHGGSTEWSGGSILSDTWEWDGVVWNRIDLPASGPKRSFHTMTYDSRRRLTVLVGGGGPYSSYTVNDTWEYDGSTWKKSLAPQDIHARKAHSAAFHEVLGKVAVFGGQNDPRRYSDLWLFNGKSWVSDDPAPAYRGRMAYDRRRGNIVQFSGGLTSTGERSSDLKPETWIFEAKSGWKKANPATTPPARVGPSLVYDEGKGEVMMFGGYVSGGIWGPDKVLRDMWVWNGSDWREVPQHGSRPHNTGPIFYDRRLQKTVMVAYRTGNQHIQVMWLWDGKSWTETTMEPPYSTWGFELVYDPISMQAIARFSRYNETWVWNGSSWKFAYSDGAAERIGGAYVFDESANKALCYGGSREFSSVADAVWWDGSAWHELGDQQPGRRAGAASAYDPVLARSVIFGGLAGGYESTSEFYDDTWAVRWVP